MKTETDLAWLIFHIVQISLFQFYAAPRLSHLSMTILRKRNPELATETLGEDTYLHSVTIDWLIGGVSILLLVLGFTSADPILYWSGNYISLFGFLFTCIGIDSIRYQRLIKLVPLKEKRSATLSPRQFGRIVPLWAWALCLLASVILIAMEKDLIKQLATAFAVLVCLSVAIFTEKKSKISNDVDEDSLYRKSEAWTVFGIACTLPLFLPFQAQLKHYGVDAIFSTIPLIFFVYFLNSKIYKKLTS